MCDCTEQLNQVMDKLGVMQSQMNAIQGQLNSVETDITTVHDFTVEANKIAEQFKVLFSEDNLMSMLGGFMGGGGIPAIGG